MSPFFRYLSYLFVFILPVLLFVLYLRLPLKRPLSPVTPQSIWAIRSIDTMKYSRDLAREKASDPSFDAVIDLQVQNIATTGATHVAIATPYDAEFVPFLSRWVRAARKYKLKVWFRGNFSGWEKWFDYKRITRQDHLMLTRQFILGSPELFADGDLFTPCPECENGGPGDPRLTRDIAGHRQFLIDEYNVATSAFQATNKKVAVGYNSMNYDVAKEIMDKDTTSRVGGIVAVDHYVKTPEKLVADLQFLEAQTGGQIFLGEFGAPIPDIHGQMTDAEQAAWIASLLSLLETSHAVMGLNYWVNVGGSTELWNEAGEASPAVSVLRTFYTKLRD